MNSRVKGDGAGMTVTTGPMTTTFLTRENAAAQIALLHQEILRLRDVVVPGSELLPSDAKREIKHLEFLLANAADENARLSAGQKDAFEAGFNDGMAAGERGWEEDRCWADYMSGRPKGGEK